MHPHAGFYTHWHFRTLTHADMRNSHADSYLRTSIFLPHVHSLGAQCASSSVRIDFQSQAKKRNSVLKQFWGQINLQYDQGRIFRGLLIQWSASAVCHSLLDISRPLVHNSHKTSSLLIYLDCFLSNHTVGCCNINFSQKEEKNFAFQAMSLYFCCTFLRHCSCFDATFDHLFTLQPPNFFFSPTLYAHSLLKTNGDGQFCVQLCIESQHKRATSVAHLTNFSVEFFFMWFSQKMPLYFVYTMVQKSQHDPMLRSGGGGGGPAFNQHRNKSGLQYKDLG